MNDSGAACTDSCSFLLLRLQVSTALMGCWSWAWVIRQSSAVGRASTRWSWRSRKPSCASWQPFWKATVLSYDPSPRHRPRKPRTPVRFLTCKVSGIMSLWPQHWKHHGHRVRIRQRSGSQRKQGEQMIPAVRFPSSLLKRLTRKHIKQVHCWQRHEPIFFFLWKKFIWMMIPTKVFADRRWFKLYCLNASNR